MLATMEDGDTVEVGPVGDEGMVGLGIFCGAVEWLWGERCERIWLTTKPGSRAEGFYAHLGWAPTGVTDKGEVRFEIQRPPLAS